MHVHHEHFRWLRGPKKEMRDQRSEEHFTVIKATLNQVVNGATTVSDGLWNGELNRSKHLPESHSLSG